MIVDPSVAYLRRRGAQIRAGSPVRGLEWCDDGRFLAAHTRDGERHAARAVVVAAAHRETSALVGERVPSIAPDRAEALGGSPIVAIHLWFDREISRDPIAGLLDSPVHWVFQRGLVGGAADPGYLALVISGADSSVGLGKAALVELARSELQRFFPSARDARLLQARTLKERRATPRFAPGAGGLRPPAATGVPNLFLAGDWTDTGLPATLEGAALSGHRAAALALEYP